MFPNAMDDRFRTTDATTTTSWKTRFGQHLQARQIGCACANTDLFPFSTRGEESDERLRYPGPTCDDSGMVNEFVGTEFEHEKSADEGGDVEGDGIAVGWT